MKTIVKIGIILLVVTILVGAGALLLRRPAETAEADATAPTAIATRGHIEETVSATGNVVAERQATLTFESGGSIAAVLVEEGQMVEAGEILARLDTTSLEWQVAQAQAGLDTAQARLEQSQRPPTAEELASAQAALDSAVASYEKVKEGPTAEELASARASLDSAEASYEKVVAGPAEEDLASAKATLDSARAAVQQAQAAYDRISYQPDVQMSSEALNLENATIELERAQANYDALVDQPADSDLASAKAQVAQAEATLAQLLEQPTEDDLAAAAAQVAQAEATLAQLLEQPKAEDVAVYRAQVEESAIALAQAQAQIEDTLLIAPFDGIVLEVNVNEGEWATTGAPAIVLAATEPLILAVNVDEVDVAQLAEGQAAHLSFDALKSLNGSEIAGTVVSIAPASIDVGGAVAYGVEIGFTPSTGSGQALPIRLGMTADVDIVVDSADDALLIPNRAIEADREAGRYYVTRLKASSPTAPSADGSIERLEVRIGLRDQVHTQILEGLEEGSVVVLPQVPEQTSSEQQFGPGQGGPFGGSR